MMPWQIYWLTTRISTCLPKFWAWNSRSHLLPLFLGTVLHAVWSLFFALELFSFTTHAASENLTHHWHASATPPLTWTLEKRQYDSYEVETYVLVRLYTGIGMYYRCFTKEPFHDHPVSLRDCLNTLQPMILNLFYSWVQDGWGFLRVAHLTQQKKLQVTPKGVRSAQSLAKSYLNQDLWMHLKHNPCSSTHGRHGCERLHVFSPASWSNHGI